MTSGHFIYIPLLLLFGITIGFVLGGRAAKDAMALEKKKAAERAARKAAREERERAGKAPGSPPA